MLPRASARPVAPAPDQPRSVAERTAAAVGRSAERELQASLRQALIGGRWVIFIATLLVGGLRPERVQESLEAEVAFGILLAYHLAVLIALSRSPAGPLPVIALLAADMVTVGAAVVVTRGISSPFAGLFYLIILTAALYYDLAGGLIVAVIASGTILATNTFITPGFWRDILQGKAAAQVVPNLILAGGFAGYLIGQLKQLHERRIEREELLRRAWYEERVRRREAELEEQLLRRDMEIAREIQQATLADPTPHPGFDIAVRFEPAQEVGGDFYSFFTAGTRLGVILGDVSGKGLPAALVSTSICHLARWLRPMEDPDGFFANMNRELGEHLPAETYASMVAAFLDPEAERLILYDAGHPPSLVLSGGALQRIQQSNLPLGLFPDVAFVPETLPFRNGDTLVLYSDAFIEARNEAGEELSIEGLEALVRRHAALPPEELAARLVEETRAFGTVTDDLTLVVVRRRPLRGE